MPAGPSTASSASSRSRSRRACSSSPRRRSSSARASCWPAPSAAGRSTPSPRRSSPRWSPRCSRTRCCSARSARFGLFRAPVLIGIDLAVILLRRRALPAIARARAAAHRRSERWRDAVGVHRLAHRSRRSWRSSGPARCVLQLASPVVPFIDVLPNYVGPVEHLRTFGWFSPLTATQSPIIGPSRTVLGYDGLLGSLATMTDLPGGLAIAGFILPADDPRRRRRAPARERAAQRGRADRSRGRSSRSR